MKPYETAVMWFRRDMRVDDNPALRAALSSARSVVCLFVWAPSEVGVLSSRLVSLGLT